MTPSSFHSDSEAAQASALCRAAEQAASGSAAAKALIDRAKQEGWLNRVDKLGELPLVYACETGSVSALSVLIDAGADMNASNAVGMSPIMRATSHSHSACLELLLERGADPNTRFCLNGHAQTPVHLAASDKKVSFLRLLARYGADLNQLSSNGYTAAMRAAEKDQLLCLTTLADLGADFNAREINADFDAMTLAAVKGGARCVEFLADHGAEVSFRSKVGRTPLIAAACFGRSDTIEALARLGADLNAKDEWGDTAASKAACGGHLDVLMALARHGASFSLRDREGDTPEQIAIKAGHLHCSAFLHACAERLQLASMDLSNLLSKPCLRM